MNVQPQESPSWDRPIERRSHRARVATLRRQSATTPTVEKAIDAWLTARAFSPSTAKAARQHLESGRARGWRAQRGIVTINELTDAAARDYLVYLRDRGAAPATLRKVKTLLSSLAAFCAETPGYEAGLCGDAMSALRLPPLVERIPDALTDSECLRVIAACGESMRNRLIVETFLLAGLRVSELCALTLDAVHLETLPCYVDVRGSAHNPHRPKTRASVASSSTTTPRGSAAATRSGFARTYRVAG